MAFDISRIGISDETGNYPSATTFTTNGNVITVQSNGDPYPAKAGNPLVNDGETPRTGFGNGYTITTKSINHSWTDRSGSNSLDPQDIQSGAVGITSNGVYLYSTRWDTDTYPGTTLKRPVQLNWNLNNFEDLLGFDQAGGRPLETGEYYYANGKFLEFAWINQFKVFSTNTYYSENSYGNDNFRHPSGHSKIIGYCFDGFPIYGPYGYRDPLNVNGPVSLMKSSYKLKEEDEHRPENYKFTDTFIDNTGTVQEISPGFFIQDYRYADGTGDLDEYNGRFCYTPEFPAGTYAYFLTFEDASLETPAFPYIVGKQTRQNRTAGVGAPLGGYRSLWLVTTGVDLSILEERKTIELQLPVANGINPRLEVISGNLPGGLRIEGSKLVGTPFEVIRDTVYTFVIRAKFNGQFEDRTFKCTVVGPDDPILVTPEGLLPVSDNKLNFVLDNALVDFHLSAIDTDLSAGDELEFFIADDDGELPPGLQLTSDGRIVGIVEPLLALDAAAGDGGYDTNVYGNFLFDFGTKSDNGYGSFFYDVEDYGYSIPSTSPKKLNRYYQFAVTVTDGDNSDRKVYTIFLVGDDFLRSDNTIMQSGTGLFTADNTYLRTPVWLTPGDLGYKRANNYVTLYLDTIQNDTLAGAVFYTMEPFNTDGTPSKLPPGMKLDSKTGEIVGTIPYQPAITTTYKFTVRATRFSGDLDTATIFAQFYEDTLLGTDNFKIIKLSTSLDDGVDDLAELRFRNININNRNYRVENVDGSNELYDQIFLNDTLGPNVSIVLAQQGLLGQDFLFVNRLKENDKSKLLSRNIKFSETESYKIVSITPYLTYSLENKLGNPNYVKVSNLEQEVGDLYSIGDFAAYQGSIYKLEIGDPVETPYVIDSFQGGNLFIDNHGIPETANGDPYIWNTLGLLPTEVENGTYYYIRVLGPDNISLHLTKSDALNNLRPRNIGGGTGVHTIDRAGASHIVTASGSDIAFKPQQWGLIAAQNSELTDSEAVAVAQNYLDRTYVQGSSFVEITSDNANWYITLPSTSYTRSIEKFVENFDNSTDLKAEIIRNSQDRINLEIPLERSLQSGRNIGIALFAGEAFSREVTVANENEETDIVESNKTFSLRVIGEIESKISWLTDSDLGTIDANFTSTLYVLAETTVPDSNLLYSITSGKLPNGLYLNYDGQIIGAAKQYPEGDQLGLTTFDNKAITFDGVREEDKTTFDREYKFKVLAQDRFKLSAIEKEFTLKVSDEDNLIYSNIYAKPFLKDSQRVYYNGFVSNPDTFTPASIYRPNDPEFGIQTELKMLVYAGIESKSIDQFVAATAKNHKRKRFRLGNIKSAEAKLPGTNDVLYEIVYIEVIDPAEAKAGKTAKTFEINTTNQITVDSLQYDAKDDDTNTGTGISELPIYGRQTVKFIVPNGNDLVIETRESLNQALDADDNDFTIELREGEDVTITLRTTDSEPYRFRPKSNTIKADTDAIKVSQSKDNLRYISNISNMREEIEKIGEKERLFLPLWMRTPQSSTFPQELDYVPAIPICYCKPGTSADILLNIANQGFDVSQIDFDIDRYIVNQTEGISQDQYLLFANYQFNV